MQIIPKPQKMDVQDGTFQLTEDTLFVIDAESAEIGAGLLNQLCTATGYQFLVAAFPPEEGDSYVEMDMDERLSGLGEEGYLLEVTPHHVRMRAARPAGMFYATRTFLQLLPADILREAVVTGVHWDIPCVEIEDQPRFGWRGMMLDCCRHFMPKEFVKKFIDLLAFYKFNRFHWHLTEDQGWRIEIRRYPKLTEVGAFRTETIIGKTWQDAEPKFDGIPHGGYYTQKDIREIVAYAAARQITVIPEIEMPGHSQAAIAAYPELGNTDEVLPVFRQWGVNPNVFNAEESTILFLQNVLTEVLELFPSEFIHVGGDECPKVQWRESAAMQQRIKELGLADEDELQSWFIRQMDRFLNQQGRRLIGWDEILEGGLAPNATVMSWRGEEGGIAAAKAGHDVVMAPNQYVYFDHFQTEEQSSEEVRIGGLTTIERVYAYEPIPRGLTEDEARHVLGAQGQIWTEYMPGPKDVEWMAFPRAAALAEVLWLDPAQKDINDFSRRLSENLASLAVLDVKYYAS